MNKRIDFSKAGGFPGTQYTWSFVQESFRGALAALASFVGDKVVIAGMVEAGGNVGNGWLSVGGELMPFVGGAIGPNVLIEELKEARVFNDGQSKEVYFTKQARFGSPGFPYTDIKRPGTVKEMWQRGDTKEVWCTPQYIIDNFDNSGKGINERVGWAIMNGQNGTPNIGGRVSVAYDPADPDFNQVGNIGGEKKHQLTIAELPVHRLKLPPVYGESGAGLKIASGNPSNLEGDGNNYTDYIGGDEAHNNLQPYMVLLKIMKL